MYSHCLVSHTVCLRHRAQGEGQLEQLSCVEALHLFSLAAAPALRLTSYSCPLREPPEKDWVSLQGSTHQPQVLHRAASACHREVSLSLFKHLKHIPSWFHMNGIQMREVTWLRMKMTSSGVQVKTLLRRLHVVLSLPLPPPGKGGADGHSSALI